MCGHIHKELNRVKFYFEWFRIIFYRNNSDYNISEESEAQDDNPRLFY